MPGIDSSRPPKLFRYSERQWLERALTLGEFRLSPPAADPGQPAARYLTLGWTRSLKDSLFDTFGVDTCLIIHDTEQFGERLHRAVQRVLPSWAGIDAPVYYGKPSPLGALFSRERADAAQEEWLFAWRPTEAMLSLNPVVVRIGSIEGIAEIRDKSAPTGAIH
jgi:hypothetical protein